MHLCIDFRFSRYKSDIYKIIYMLKCIIKLRWPPVQQEGQNAITAVSHCKYSYIQRQHSLRVRTHVSSQSLERSGYGRMSFHRFSKHWRDLALNAVPRSDDGDTRIIHEPALSAVRGRSNCGRLRLFWCRRVAPIPEQKRFKMRKYGSAIIMTEP